MNISKKKTHQIFQPTDYTKNLLNFLKLNMIDTLVNHMVVQNELV